MRFLIINNLAAGLGDGTIFDFLRKLSMDGDELVVRNTNGQTRIGDMLGDAADFDAVVAAGGDGTNSSVCYELRNTGVPIFAFPAGTGNLLTMNLDLPTTIPALVDILREPMTLDFDLGELDFELNGKPLTYGFAVIAGAGYDAEIMRAAAAFKPAFGHGSYVAAAFSRPTPKFSRFTIGLPDGEITVEGISVLVLNFARINADISITHANNARDGLFEVVVLKSHNAVQLIPALFMALLDREGNNPGRFNAIETHFAKSVSVDSDPTLYLQFDGEAPDATTPFAARVLPGAARLIVSPKAYEKFKGCS
ncbi:MAG: NAD(+)/NADH kinase [Coriobacteriia bacterium]|nr:NAD(+)/NADH kinase [Coriobacteriia bacterium]